MKPSKLLILFITLAFTATLHAEYKFAKCERAEKAFWDTIQKADSDESILQSLDGKTQITSYKITLGNLEQSINEVRKRCNGVASEHIVASYNKKKSEINKNINAL